MNVGGKSNFNLKSKNLKNSFFFETFVKCSYNIISFYNYVSIFLYIFFKIS